MTKIQEIKSEIKEAMKTRDDVKRDILRLVIGQAQQDGDESDNNLVKIVKKIIKSNLETLDMYSEKITNTVSLSESKLIMENYILHKFLPLTMSEEEIEAFISDNNIDISSAKNEGQAMGMFIKALKKSGKEFDSNIVKNIVIKKMNS